MQTNVLSRLKWADKNVQLTVQGFLLVRETTLDVHVVSKEETFFPMRKSLRKAVLCSYFIAKVPTSSDTMATPALNSLAAIYKCGVAFYSSWMLLFLNLSWSLCRFLLNGC